MGSVRPAVRPFAARNDGTDRLSATHPVEEGHQVDVRIKCRFCRINGASDDSTYQCAACKSARRASKDTPVHQEAGLPLSATRPV